MADDTALLVLWTVVAVLLGIYALWKYIRNTNRQEGTTNKVPQDVQNARLKYFSTNEKTVLNANAAAAKRTEDENVFEKSLDAKASRDEKKSDYAAVKPSVLYTRTIEAPGNEVVHGAGSTSGRLYDPLTGGPITQPLYTLEEVLLWRQGFDCFNVASVPLNERCRKLERKPRTLVCHDMKGGYIEDRFVQGFGSSDCYVIYHWHLIDIFVYFSHHFITIPPPCWTNAAHTHGVPVLGTVITESEEGIKRCSEFLESRASWETLANQLVDIAEYYGFDGWLLNIENHIQPVQINNLEKFVKYLTTIMHERIEGSLVIWYDSVTYKGELDWQNELNGNNRMFFDACDGIFLNYTWSEAQLMRSAGAAGRDRMLDVYVGVDAFGRGCFGGGGYNCNKAFKVIREEKLSVALFAPGWVMETQGAEKFITHQDKFWDLLAPYCTLHSPVKKIPFVTSMCRGYGNTASLDGVVAYSKPWTNLSGQQCQPTYSNMFFNLGAKGGLAISSIKYTMKEAYNGGGCQVITGRLNPADETSKGVARLFKTDLHITGPVLVSFTFKLHPRDGVEVSLQLRTNKLPTYLLLCPAPCNDQDYSNTEDSGLNEKLIHRYGIPQSRNLTSSVFMSPIGQEHYKLFAPLTGASHDLVQQAQSPQEKSEVGDTSWYTRHYLIAGKQFVGCAVEEIRVICSTLSGGTPPSDFEVHLGEIKIVDPNVLKQSLAPVRNIRSVDIEWKSADQRHLLSLTLMWDCPISGGQVEKAAHYNVFRVIDSGSSEFLGRAFVEAYRVCQLPISRNRFTVEFIVQLVTRSGLKKPLNECSRIRFMWV